MPDVGDLAVAELRKRQTLKIGEAAFAAARAFTFPSEPTLGDRAERAPAGPNCVVLAALLQRIDMLA